LGAEKNYLVSDEQNGVISFLCRHCEEGRSPDAATQRVLAQTLTLSGLPHRLRLLAMTAKINKQN